MQHLLLSQQQQLLLLQQQQLLLLQQQQLLLLQQQQLLLLQQQQLLLGHGLLSEFSDVGSRPHPTHKHFSRITSERILVTTVVLLMSYYDDSM